MSKKFLAIVFGLFAVTFVAFFFVLNWGSQLSAPQNNGSGATFSAGPAAPKTPSVTFTILKTKNGNMFRVQWENLPGNTVRIKIFRSLKGKDNWSLWKTLTISGDQFGSGFASFNIGNATFSNYSFYVEAVGNGTGTGSGTGTSEQTALWTSSSTNATVSTTTTSQTTSVTISSTTSTITPSTTSTPTTTTATTSSPGTTSASSSTTQGTAYYTPQLQISGYSPGQTGAFWVQHVDQKIQIGWQNLPSNTTHIDIFRSPNQNGPWTGILSQENPGVNGSYSIQVVDNTLGLSYYYGMNALASGAIIATYGPVYLPPVGQ